MSFAPPSPSNPEPTSTGFPSAGGPPPSRSTLIERHSAWVLSRRRAREHPPARWQMGRDEEGRMEMQSLPVA